MLPERRYAEWLPGAEAPKKPVLAVGALALFQGSFLAILASSQFMGIDWVLAYTPWIIGGVMIPAYILMFVGLSVESRRLKQRYPVADLPEMMPQFSTIVILEREIYYGSAAGRVSFVDGWLVFASRNCNFSVRAQDVSFEADDGKPIFSFPGPDGPLRARFLQPTWDGEWKQWTWSSSPSEGIPIYPPAILSPVWRKHQAWLWVGLYVLSIGLLSIRTLPLAGIFELGLGAFFLVIHTAQRAAFRRLQENKPPLSGGLFAAKLGYRRNRWHGAVSALVGRSAEAE